ncbi:MAG: hypothetical protein HZA78_04290 [Candidatus Schekmanbacteria bacterium]|nr:hypothetical protein [Candidatus Schekmanbacteria bacterium]
MSFESEKIQPEFLQQLRSVFEAKSRRYEQTRSYCGHETNAEQLEFRLWEYASGDMPDDLAEPFWERIQECPYCLEKLLQIQQSIRHVDKQLSYPPAQINKLIKQKNGANLLDIALGWVKGLLELINTTGLLLPPEPVPVIRGSAQISLPALRIAEEFEKCTVQVLAEKTDHQTCNIEVKVQPLIPLAEDLKVTLKKSQRLLISKSLTGDGIGFEELTPGSYQIILALGNESWGQILLQID